jgi:N-acyl-L-homoserine lactone synthetase
VIECVTWATEHRFSGSPLSQQFHLRFKSSILMEEWTGVYVNPSEVSSGYEECDQYDTRYAEYLIKRDVNGDILGTIRTGPTTAPYMMKDHFSNLFGKDYDPPCSPKHHELSRMTINRDLLTREQSRNVTNQLLLAAQERGLQRGIEAYWGIVIEIVADKVFRRAGYDVVFTGPPTIYPNTGERIFGVKLPVNEAVYCRCQHISGIHRPVLTFGSNEEGKKYPVLRHESPLISDEFFQSKIFERAAGRKSIHASRLLNNPETIKMAV